MVWFLTVFSFCCIKKRNTIFTCNQLVDVISSHFCLVHKLSTFISTKTTLQWLYLYNTSYQPSFQQKQHCNVYTCTKSQSCVITLITFPLFANKMTNFRNSMSDCQHTTHIQYVLHTNQSLKKQKTRKANNPATHHPNLCSFIQLQLT